MNEPATLDAADMSQADPANTRRRLPLRFSLATLILLATIVCLAVSLWTTSRRFRQATLEAETLRAEIQKYREEMGYLTISDPSKVHAIGVHAHGNFKWQWRVYLPENRRFWMHVVTGGVPQRGVPAPGTSSRSAWMVESGQSLFYAAVEKDQRDNWVFCVDEGNSGSASQTGIHQAHEQWLERGVGWTTEQVTPGRTQTFEPGQPIVLLRLRVHESVEKAEDGTTSTSSREPEEPCDGLMIWIDETP